MDNINPTNMYFAVMLVTPEMAAEWLKTNTRNRNPNKDKLNKLKSDMLNGQFQLTHQSIAFDTDGNLIDGQHRLISLVETGVTVPLAVAFNAPVSPNLDIGTKRTMKQSLYMAGIIDKGTTEYDPLTFPLISFIVYRSLGEDRARRLTAMNRHNIYINCREYIDPVIQIGAAANGRCRSSAILYSMLCAYYSGVDISTLKKWHKIVETGDFYVNGDDMQTQVGRSVLKFKEIANKTVSVSITRNNKTEIEEIIKKAMSSISHFNNGDIIAKLYGEYVYPDIPITERDIVEVKENE